jgi:hypothetical protein
MHNTKLPGRCSLWAILSRIKPLIQPTRPADRIVAKDSWNSASFRSRSRLFQNKGAKHAKAHGWDSWHGVIFRSKMARPSSAANSGHVQPKLQMKRAFSDWS